MKTQLFLLSLVQVFLFLFKKICVTIGFGIFSRVSFIFQETSFIPRSPSSQGLETQPGHLIYIISLSWVWMASRSSMNWGEFEEKHFSFIPLLMLPPNSSSHLLPNLPGKSVTLQSDVISPCQSFQPERLRAHQFYNNGCIMTVPLVLLSPKSPFRDGDWRDKG